MPPKPPLKRRCFRCDKLDAKFCSGKCRIAIYRLRLADDAKVDERPIFEVRFRPEPEIDGPRALKSLMKFALRKYGLRVVTARERPAKDAAA
jgi:hypothetical protein